MAPNNKTTPDLSTLFKSLDRSRDVVFVGHNPLAPFFVFQPRGGYSMPTKPVTYSYTTIDPPDSVYALSLDMNDAGQIVGYYQDSNHIQHGFLYSGGNYTTLDPPGSADPIPSDINASGQIIGTYFFGSSGGQLGFLYSHGVYTTLDVGTRTDPTDINDKGQVVGDFITIGDGHQHGFLYSGGNYTILDAPGSVITIPTSINNKGQIVGEFILDNTNGH